MQGPTKLQTDSRARRVGSVVVHREREEMFDEMVSEKLIEWIWILASAGIVIFGLLMMFAGGGFLGFLMAVMYIAIGLLVVRVVCEAMVVGFKVHHNNKRSLAVMEQISREQTATRKAIQAFLEQTAPSMAPATAQPVPTAARRLPADEISDTTTRPAISSDTPDALKKDDYHDRMMAIREQLQRDAQQKRT